MKRFVAKKGATPTVTAKTDFTALYTLEVGAAGNPVWAASLIPGTINEDFDAEDFKDFNSTSTTLSFDAPNLVGNVFEGLIPVDASEIDDYIKVINEYNLKNEAKKIENETKEDIDFNLKQEKLKKIVELKLRGEKND